MKDIGGVEMPEYFGKLMMDTDSKPKEKCSEKPDESGEAKAAK